MNLRAACLAACCLLATPAVCLASGKAKPAVSLGFHLETEEGGNPKMVRMVKDGTKERYYFRAPEISLRDVVAYRAFPSGDPNTYGLVFQLKPQSAKRLAAVCIANQGKYLLAEINGRYVDGVIIDKPVEDGFIVIWKNVTDLDLKLFEKALPLIGEDGKKKKKKD